MKKQQKQMEREQNEKCSFNPERVTKKKDKKFHTKSQNGEENQQTMNSEEKEILVSQTRDQ